MRLLQLRHGEDEGHQFLDHYSALSHFFYLHPVTGAGGPVQHQMHGRLQTEFCSAELLVESGCFQGASQIPICQSGCSYGVLFAECKAALTHTSLATDDHEKSTPFRHSMYLLFLTLKPHRAANMQATHI